MAVNKQAAPKEKGRRFSFEGKNTESEQVVHGEVVALNEEEARRKLQRRGIIPLSVTRVKQTRKKRITQADITVFTRQLATMMKAGLPLMQAFEIVARGHSNPSMTELLMSIRADVEQGNSLGSAFSKHPKYFDRFYCNLVAAGEAGGVLEGLLEKLAVYKEKTQSIKKKVKSALTYPIAIVVVAIVLIMVMMMYVLPAFGKVYEGMGAELPLLTQQMMNISRFFVAYGWIIILFMVAFVVVFVNLNRKSPSFQKKVDAQLLKVPFFGDIMRKAIIARWARTTSSLFAAGVPLVESLESVAGAAGNSIYEAATYDIRSKVSQGISFSTSMRSTNLFPNMVLQMASIGEESGALDDMLNKAAEFYEEEVDNTVAQLSSLMEPIIMAVLGSIVGVILIAMYLPLFNLGNVIG